MKIKWPCDWFKKDLVPVAPVNVWQIQHSNGMPGSPTMDGSKWYFDFPVNTGSVHYVVRGHNGPISGQLGAQFEITGSDDMEFVPVGAGDEVPCYVRLYFQRTGDDLTADKQFYRWWSIDRTQLAKTSVVNLSVPLNPENWISVFGRPGSEAPAEFQAAMADVQAIGQTYSGKVFAGHGARLSRGDARFTQHNYSVG